MSTIHDLDASRAGDAPPADETDSGAGAHEAAVEPTVLRKVRDLIAARTRFEPEDVQGKQETLVDQGLIFEVDHVLDARIEAIGITGHFLPQASDKASADPHQAAAADLPNRLRLAGRLLKHRLEQSDTAYDFKGEGGVYLGDATRYWQLDNCTACNGRGKNRCSLCYGSGQNTCHTCSGSRQNPCDAYGCFNGRKNCTTCGGSGHVTKQVGEYVSVSVLQSDGSYHNDNQYRTRSETHSCTAYGCSYGKVICSRCRGTSYVSCGTCHATGQVSCNHCNGLGHIRCAPCEGSGQTGICAWVDVHGKPAYGLRWTGDVDERAADIETRIGLHGVATATAGLTLRQIRIDNEPCPEAVTATYAAVLPVAHLDAVCNARDYHLVAYGIALDWLDLDEIVETLLRVDLEALRNALVIASGEGIFASSVETLAQPLRHVTESEINTEIVEATLSGEALDKLHVLTSAEYVTQVHDSMLAALRQIYTREAKRLAWRIPLVVLVLGVAIGLLFGGVPAALAGLVSIPLTHLFFTRRVRSVLAQALGGLEQGKRALSLIVKGRRHRFAQGLLNAPLAVLAGLLLMVPQYRHAADTSVGLPGPAQTAAAGSENPSAANAPAMNPASVAMTGAHGSAATGSAGGTADPALAPALALLAQGQYAQARPVLRQQAEAGNAHAFGPYAVSLMYDDDHHALTNETPQLRAEALQWAQRAVQANPTDAASLEAEGELLTSDWKHVPDMRRGMLVLKQAALLGSTDAMHQLGMIYGNGRHVPQNMNESRTWFAMAAKAGQAVDLYNLGLMDWYGYAMPHPDRQAALQLWQQAAAKGEARAIRAVAQGHPPV